MTKCNQKDEMSEQLPIRSRQQLQ